MKATESRAIAIAREHCEAWSHHDYETARKSLSENVTVTATSTFPGAPKTDLKGADAYMVGLKAFADTVKPGSLIVNHAVGDDRNALLMVTVKTEGAPFGPTTLPGARLYAIGDDGRINAEQVIFYMVPE